MIPRTKAPATTAPAAISGSIDLPVPPAANRRPARWQRSLTGAVKTLGELLDLLGIDASTLEDATEAHREFPLRVPRGFVRRMRPGDPLDPLLRQVLPVAEELRIVPGYTRDPLAERGSSPTPGLLHKYRGRVLLLATGACAVHCRYCFRRHFPYEEHAPRIENWRQALRYIAADPTIDEVILSGGDPLSVSDDKLAALAAALAEIPHLRRLRIHTRLPIVLPERVDRALLTWLEASRLASVVIVHANHPREIDSDVRAALTDLRAVGATVLNQAVLLAGVNDRTDILRQLSEVLFTAGVLPYYLHLVDKVEGAAHFAVSEAAARELVWDLMQQLPGYLVPRLVRETAGAPAKLPICPMGGLMATNSRNGDTIPPGS